MAPLCLALLLAQEPLPLAAPAPMPELEIFGRVMFDAAFVGGPVADEVGAAVGEELMDGAEIRRARLDVRGQLAPDLRGWLGLEFAGGQTRFREASLGWARVPSEEWKLGYFKQPFFLDLYGSSNDFNFLEAPVAEDALAPGRQGGLLFSNWSERHSLGASIYRKVPETTGVSVNEGYGGASRAVWRPLFRPEKGRLLHLAGSLGWENPDGPVRFAARPEQHLLPFFVDTGELQADSVLRYGLELAGTWGRWHTSAEWMGAELEGAAVEGATLRGWNVAGGCFLTGEPRPYDRKKGVWSRVVPRQDYQPGGGGRGAWEAVARLSALDLGEAGAGEIEIQSLGLNWYWTEHVRVLLTLNRSLLDDYDAVHGAALRVGFDF